MMSNGVVVGVIFKSRELHMPSHWMIAFMASWDFVTGGLCLLTATPSAFLDYFPYPESLIPVVACMLTFIACQNVLNMCMVVADRYFAIRFPMRYPRIAVTRNYLLLFILSLMLSLSRLLILTSAEAKFHFNNTVWLPFLEQRSVLVSIIAGCFVVIPFGAMIVISVPVYKNIRHANTRVTPQGEQSNVSKFPLMVLISAAVFCISHIPVTVAILLENVNTFRFTILLWVSNSLWNVFIYVRTYRPFKQAFTRLSCKAYYRRQRQKSMLNLIQTDNH